MSNLFKYKKELDDLLTKYTWYISTSVTNNCLEVNIEYLSKDAECIIPRTFCGCIVKIIINKPIKFELK